MQTAILTRPAGKNEALAQRLRGAGWQVGMLPALTVEPLPSGAASVPLPNAYDVVIFVSGNAVRFYLEQLLHRGIPSGWPATTLAATVGLGTAQALRSSGWFDSNSTILHPDDHSPKHDSEALWDLLQRQPLPLRKVLLVRGTTGRDWLVNKLVANGVKVTCHAVYRRYAARWEPQQLIQLQFWVAQRLRPVWLLTSGEGIRAINAALQNMGLAQWWACSHFVVTHPSLVAQLPVPPEVIEHASIVKICLPTEDAIFNAFVAA